MRCCVTRRGIMRKHKTGLCLLLLASFALPVRAAAPVAGTAEEVASRLQRSIDRALEQGHYEYVQTLRQELARHYAAAGAFALAARQYELLLSSRPSRRERVAYFVELGKMRDADRD